MEGIGPRMAPTPPLELAEPVECHGPDPALAPVSTDGSISPSGHPGPELGSTHPTDHPRVPPGSEGLHGEDSRLETRAPGDEEVAHRTSHDSNSESPIVRPESRVPSPEPAALEALLDGRRLWRASGRDAASRQGLPTGRSALDAVLPGGGWPTACLSEILCAHPGSGELSLVLPALAQCAASGGWICWVAPPHVPYPPALATVGLNLSRQLVIQPPAGKNETTDALWAMEQALLSGACDAVLAWVEPREAYWPRRLQLAAEQGESRGFLFRDLRAAQRPSAAALRMKLTADALEIMKCRGGRPIRLRRAPHSTHSS
jgi:protein ImuA